MHNDKIDRLLELNFAGMIYKSCIVKNEWAQGEWQSVPRQGAESPIDQWNLTVLLQLLIWWKSYIDNFLNFSQ